MLHPSDINKRWGASKFVAQCFTNHAFALPPNQWIAQQKSFHTFRFSFHSSTFRSEMELECLLLAFPFGAQHQIKFDSSKWFSACTKTWKQFTKDWKTTLPRQDSPNGHNNPTCGNKIDVRFSYQMCLALSITKHEGHEERRGSNLRLSLMLQDAHDPTRTVYRVCTFSFHFGHKKKWSVISVSIAEFVSVAGKFCFCKSVWQIGWIVVWLVCTSH